MAILRLSNGEIYTEYEAINAITEPVGMKLGSFLYTQPQRDKWHSHAKPLSSDGVKFALGDLASSVESLVQELGFSYEYRRVGSISRANPDSDTSVFSVAGDGHTDVMSMEMTGDDMLAYKAPHILQVPNLHFCLSGAFVKGFVISDELQGVIYVPPGDYQMLDATVKNWVRFPNDTAAGGLSFFATPPGAEGLHPTVPLPDLDIKETMEF